MSAPIRTTPRRPVVDFHPGPGVVVEFEMDPRAFDPDVPLDRNVRPPPRPPRTPSLPFFPGRPTW